MLIDDSQFLDDVVMEAIEGDNESTNTWRLNEQPLFGENVLLQEPIFESPDSLLLIHVVTVQGA